MKLITSVELFEFELPLGEPELNWSNEDDTYQAERLFTNDIIHWNGLSKSWVQSYNRGWWMCWLENGLWQHELVETCEYENEYQKKNKYC